MNRERNGLGPARSVLRLVARCSCFSVFVLSLTDPNPGARIISSNAQGIYNTRQHRVALRAPIRSAIIEAASQSAASEQHPGAAGDYLRDAERLRSEWREASLRLAIQKYRSAIARFGHEHDKAGQAEALLGAGEVLAILGEPDSALIQYRRALDLCPAHDMRLEADILNRLAEIEIDKSNASGEAHARRAQELADRADYKAGQAGALRNLGVIAYTQRDAAKAIDYFNRALSLWQSEGDPAGQAEALTNLGFTYGDSGAVKKASECFDKALDLAKAAGHAQKEARIALAIGLVHTVRGEWQRALDRYQRTVSILDQIGDRATQAVALNGLGYLYSELGETGQSFESFKKSLVLSRRMGLRGREALTLSHIADLYAETGHKREALRIYHKLVLVGRALRDPKTEAYALSDAGAVYESLGNLKRALRCYQQSLVIGRSLNHPRVQAYSLGRLGTLYRRMHRWAEAREKYEAAMSLMRQAGDRAGETLIAYNIAKLKQVVGETDDALRDIEKVIQTAEALRSDVISSDLRTIYFASVYDRYQLLVDLLMQKHAREPNSSYDVAAFEACELGRARTLSEMLIEARANIREGVPAELLEREHELSIQLANKASGETTLREVKFKLEKARPAKGEKRAEELAKNNRDLESVSREINELTAQLDQATTEILASSPKKYATLVRAQRASLKQLQNEVLDSETLVLEYSLGDERSYLWVVGRSSFNSYVLPGKAEIEREASRFYRALTSLSTTRKVATVPLRSRADAKTFRAARERLSRLLFGPIAGSIGSKRLVIVPDGALQYVPFAGLPEPDSKQPLAATHELATLPSLSVLLQLRNEAPGLPKPLKTLAVIADPVVEERDPRLSENAATATNAGRSRNIKRSVSIMKGARDPLTGSAGVDGAINFVRLPYAAEEAEALAALLPKSEIGVWTGFEANRQMVTGDELRDFRVVHFATHGLLDFRHPKLSCLLLSRFDRAGNPRDGSLRLHDVYKLKLSADLVVLSACQTALGKEIRGEGLVGLTRGFMYAGAPRVVASLWNVDDRATAKLMERFYRKMLGPERLSPAAALRAAQVEMMRDESWQDPYFWAGFLLQGEWK